MPLSAAGSGVNALADLGADSVWVVGEGASVIVFLGLGLHTTKSVSITMSKHCGSKEERKRTIYRANGSIADDNILCALVQLDWRGGDTTNQGQGQGQEFSI